jgi:type IV secretory pathway VirB3-like protein
VKKEETTRIIITLPETVHTALKRIAAVEDVPMAAIVRYALIEWMHDQGLKVQDNVFWGGARYSPNIKDEDADVTV